MPDRKYTYSVEVDAQSAETAARQIRALFQRELGDILPAAGGQTGPARALQGAQAAAGETRQAMERIAGVDVAGGMDELNRQLQEARRNATLARNELERLSHVSTGAGGDRRRANALFDVHVEAVRRQVSDEAANKVRLAGRAANIGQLGAEHPSDHIDYDILNDTIAAQDAVREKQRFTAEEKRALLQAEAAAYDADLQVTRLERETADQRLAGLNRQTSALLDSGEGLTEQNAHIFEEADEAEQAAKLLAANEAELLQSVESANKRLADFTAKEAARTARAEAKRTGAIYGAGESEAGAYTQQTALTVTSKSAEQAERLAASMKEAAAASERMNAALMAVDRRAFELDTYRERTRIEQGGRVRAEQEIETIRTAEAQKRAEIALTTDATKQAAREKEAAEKQAAKAAAAAVKQAARETAAAEKQAAKEAVAAQRQAAKEGTAAKREAAKAAKQAAKETAAAEKQAAKEAAAEAKKAAREVAAAKRAAAEAGEGKFMRDALGKPFGMSWGSLIGGAGAMVGLYGADQLARGTYDAGRSGAQQMRQEDSFRQFAASQGRSAEALVASIRKASNETITATDAMGLASQVLAQKFAASRGSITSDLDTLVKFARRASQIYRDESGAFLSTQEIFARLIKYAREGNKELVDQFGLSNAAIAEALGTTVDGLASANGATDRWKGLIMVLQDEVGRLGEASLSTADKMEQSEARITDSWQRVQKALAEPTAIAMDFVADTAEGLARNAKARDPQARFTVDELHTIGDEAEQMQREQGVSRLNGGPEVQAERLEAYRKAVDAIADAQAKGYGPAAAWADALKETANALDVTNEISGEGATAIALINAAYAEELPLIDSLAEAHQAAAQAAEEEAESIANAEEALKEFLEQIGETNTELLALAKQMAAGLHLNVSLNTANTTWQEAAELSGRTRYVPTDSWIAVDPVTGRQRYVPGGISVPSSPFAGTTTGETLRNLGGTRTDLMANPRAEAERQDMYDTWDLREERRREEEAAAKEAERAWTSAAKSAASDFEQAANDAAGAFKSALEAVPGLFGTTDVTEEDMQAAELGIYEEKADEYLRQLRDEVKNGKDYPGVSLADIAGAAGIDQGLSPEAQLAKIEAMWNDSSLFANPNALRFLNKDAIQAEQERGERSEQGRQNILSWLGLDADSPLSPDQKDAFAEMIGLDEGSAQAAGTAARTAFDEGFYSPTTAPTGGEDAAGEAGYAQTLVDQISADIEAGPVADALYGLGGGIFGGIYAGYTAAAQDAEWGEPVMQSLAQDVAPIVFQMMKDQFPPA